MHWHLQRKSLSHLAGNTMAVGNNAGSVGSQAVGQVVVDYGRLKGELLLNRDNVDDEHNDEPQNLHAC